MRSLDGLTKPLKEDGVDTFLLTWPAPVPMHGSDEFRQSRVDLPAQAYLPESYLSDTGAHRVHRRLGEVANPHPGRDARPLRRSTEPVAHLLTSGCGSRTGF